MQRWGLTVPLTGIGLRDNAELLRRAEAAGYTDLWSGETNGPDGFTPLTLASAWTKSSAMPATPAIRHTAISRLYPQVAPLQPSPAQAT